MADARPWLLCHTRSCGLRLEPRDWLPRYLRIDLRVVLLGILSFGLFATLAAAIALAMGIFQGDLSIASARPDTRPDPDVVGWGFFLLALVPGIWEELAFRGLILSKLREGFRTTGSILISAAFFGLFHLTNAVSLPLAVVVLQVIMATAFGIGWGIMTVRARGVLPAMIAHYLVDNVGQVFLGIDTANPALELVFFMLLTITYPLFSIMLAKLMYRDRPPMAQTIESGQGPEMSYDPL